jgi:hypothetical protein
MFVRSVQICAPFGAIITPGKKPGLSLVRAAHESRMNEACVGTCHITSSVTIGPADFVDCVLGDVSNGHPDYLCIAGC